MVKDNCSGFHSFLAYGTLTGRVDYVKLSSSFSNIQSKAGGGLRNNQLLKYEKTEAQRLFEVDDFI